ncbi:MAG: tRNA(Met) cytidine acetyltransferase TmcA [Halodesulfurarchaeum sp.]
MMIGALAGELREEASLVDERRLLVLAGAPAERFDAAGEALSGADIDPVECVLVSEHDRLPCDVVEPQRADTLLGTTQSAVVLDCHDACHPNAIGRLVGTVDGGGLFVLLVPSLDDWPDQRDGFDETLAVPPATIEDVTGRFRRRLVETLRAHRGIAIVDLDQGQIVENGLTDPAPGREAEPDQPPPVPPEASAFPRAAFETCLTQDQVDAVAAFETLYDPPSALVLEADRGRGKSSAAGIAAACFAGDGESVLVTAPNPDGAAEVFKRARELLGDRDQLQQEPPDRSDETPTEEGTATIRTLEGGEIRFEPPPEAVASVEEADVLIVDEAAALPVRLLSDLLAADRVAFTTTVHGYEGTGRGFDVRFRDRLEDADHAVTDVSMVEPIRYAAGDPVEVWAFHALLLDARPVPEQVVADAGPDRVEYRALDQETLATDETLLREAFGLLVYAHYRTEPDDLARLLDAPNLSVRALLHDGHVVSVALLAREGDLDAETRRAVYEGSRIRGNMLPDVLMSQLRDEDAGRHVGLRVMRIATHHAARSRGLGSHLLAEIETEFADTVDWLGVGYGATPELVRFWEANGYGTVHLATTRNEASGEYSVLMLRPTSAAGVELRDRHAAWFAGRIRDVLSDALTDMDPDVARAALRACPATPNTGRSLSEADWRLVASAAYGPALYSVDPRPFRDLALAHLIGGDPELLDARQERLLVAKLLQQRPWPAVARDLTYHSPTTAMRSLGDALKPLVDEYGTEAARSERERYVDVDEDSDRDGDGDEDRDGAGDADGDGAGDADGDGDGAGYGPDEVEENGDEN